VSSKEGEIKKMSKFRQYDRPNCCDKTIDKNGGVWFESVDSFNSKTGWVHVEYCTPALKTYTLANIDFCPYCGTSLPLFFEEDVIKEAPVSLRGGVYIYPNPEANKLMVYTFDKNRTVSAIKALRTVYDLSMQEARDMMDRLPMEMYATDNLSLEEIFSKLNDSGFDCCLS
jgi:ribosomal protein L7/L12